LNGLLSLAQAGAPSGPARPAGAPAGGPGSMINSFLFPMALIFVVFYFMMIRPEQKKRKEQLEWLKNLKKGDEVVTSGGLVGKITGLTESIVTLELQEKVRVRVLRSHITGKPPAPNAPVTAPAATTDGPAATPPPK
jgi:preprotein translocase subunit YajC